MFGILNHTRYHKIEENSTTTTSGYVNELVRLRTMGHLIEKKYQVTGHYVYRGVHDCISGKCAMVE